jgi:hypothetical protein
MESGINAAANCHRCCSNHPTGELAAVTLVSADAATQASEKSAM